MATNRPRGFAAWKPQAKTRQLLDQVQTVLDEYQDSLPLTVRQIFYRLVATAGFDKTDQAYERLLNLVNRARRAGLVPMDHIRDDGSISAGISRFDSPAQFLASCHDWASTFELDLLQYQPQHVEVLCEAGGMVPQLERVARPYGVAVRSSGGFDSTTVKHQLGKAYGALRKPVTVLHVGDLDPSGVHICSNLAEDVGAFASRYGCESLQVLRLAVTAEQQAAFDLPTSKPKEKDKREYPYDFTVQAEALPPDQLAAIVRNAIEQQLDLAAHELALAQQAEHRQQLQRTIATLLTES